MQKGIIGKKIGMTQIFDEKGNAIAVTVIEAGPCVVVQKKTEEKYRRKYYQYNKNRMHKSLFVRSFLKRTVRSKTADTRTVRL